jgi:hypothetical protein
MAKKEKIWKVILGLLVVSIVINGAYFYLNSAAMTNRNMITIVTILTPVVSAINYLIMGLAAGLGFYLAKQSVEK